MHRTAGANRQSGAGSSDRRPSGVLWCMGLGFQRLRLRRNGMTDRGWPQRARPPFDRVEGRAVSAFGVNQCAKLAGAKRVDCPRPGREPVQPGAGASFVGGGVAGRGPVPLRSSIYEPPLGRMIKRARGLTRLAYRRKTIRGRLVFPILRLLETEARSMQTPSRALQSHVCRTCIRERGSISPLNIIRSGLRHAEGALRCGIVNSSTGPSNTTERCTFGGLRTARTWARRPTGGTGHTLITEPMVRCSETIIPRSTIPATEFDARERTTRPKVGYIAGQSQAAGEQILWQLVKIKDRPAPSAVHRTDPDGACPRPAGPTVHHQAGVSAGDRGLQGPWRHQPPAHDPA